MKELDLQTLALYIGSPIKLRKGINFKTKLMSLQFVISVLKQE